VLALPVVNLEKEWKMVDIREFKDNSFTVRKGLLSKACIARLFANISEIFDQALLSEGADPSRYADVDQKYFALKELNPEFKSHCYDLTH